MKARVAGKSHRWDPGGRLMARDAQKAWHAIHSAPVTTLTGTVKRQGTDRTGEQREAPCRSG